MNDFTDLTQRYSGGHIHKIERGESSGSVTIRLKDGRRIRLKPIISSGDPYGEATSAIVIESL